MNTASILEYNETEAGTGAPAVLGKTVKGHYSGKYPDSKVFDSSISRGELMEYILGRGCLIKCWDEKLP